MHEKDIRVNVPLDGQKETKTTIGNNDDDNIVIIEADFSKARKHKES